MQKKNSKRGAVKKEFLKDLLEQDEKLTGQMDQMSNVFANAKEHTDVFQQLYVQPLLDEGLTVEAALDLLVEGIARPN